MKDRNASIDRKIEKWKNRPLVHLSTDQLNELVEDLREETTAIELNRKDTQEKRRGGKKEWE